MKNSKAYDCLIKQLSANGSDKMDGYYPEVMEEIYDWEREEVEDIIWDAFFYKNEIELAQFFPKLKKYDGIKALKESPYLLQIPSEASVEISKILYEATGDEGYLDIIKKNIDAKVSDTSWIDMVEECIPYLDNIIRNPRRFIVQEENIVPIEKAKVVTEESIRHLAQHTSMIQEVQEDGTVIPLKLLNVYREETVDLYENRFIKSLVDNLYTFVTNKLEESDQKSYAKVDSEVTYKGIMKKKDEVVEVNLQLTSKKETDVDASKDGHSLDERIEHIRDIVSAFRSSTFIKSLKESSPVRSPIRKTNVILKEQNFIKALELWEYLEKNNIKPVTSIEKRNEVSKSNDVKTLYDLAFFINSDALDTSKEESNGYNSAIVSKLVNDFVFSGDITEKEFKKLMEKEFKEANKRKEKATSGIKKCIEAFLDDVDKKKKKMVTIIK